VAVGSNVMWFEQQYEVKNRTDYQHFAFIYALRTLTTATLRQISLLWEIYILSCVLDNRAGVNRPRVRECTIMLAIDNDVLREALVKTAISKDWQHKYAKFGKTTQSLFVHSVNAYSLARILGLNLFDLTNEESILVSVAAFFHDYQKAEDRWQEAAIRFMKGERPPKNDFAHDSGSSEKLAALIDLLEKVDSETGINLKSYAERMLRIIVYTHDAANSAAALKRKQEVGALDPLTKVVRLCDSISSIKSAEDIGRKAKDPDIPAGKTVVFDYHSVSVIRGVTSSLLNEAVINLLRECGYIPLLHFGSGTIYMRISDADLPENPRARLKEFVLQQFNNFQDSDVYERGIVKAVVGPVTQTKWPAIHLVREKDVEVILKNISSQPLTNKTEEFGRQYYEQSREKDKKNKGTPNIDGIEEFVAATGSLSRDVIIAEMVSDFNLMIYVADFVKRYREFAETNDKEEDYEKDVNKWLSMYLGNFVLEDMNKIGNTTPAFQRTAVVEKLWCIGTKDLHKSKNRRDEIISASTKLLKTIVNHYGFLAPPLIEDEVFTGLISDIKHLPINLASGEEVRKISESVATRYRKGKSSTDRLCNLCSLEGVVDAPAGLFGDGSEKFSNTLEGGTNIGARKKAQVCRLCMLEGTLRAFFFGSPPYGTFLVFPDLSLSPDGFALWSNAINDTVRTEHVGLGIGRSWNMREVYEHLSHGKTLDTSSELVRLMSPTKQEVKGLADFLSQNREFPNEVDYETCVNGGIDNTFEAIASAHIKGQIEIEKHLMNDYEPKSRSQRSSYFTANHAITFLKDAPREEKEEAPSTSALRIQLMALILSDIFHARVAFIEGYQPFTQFDMDGMVHIEIPAPAENALRSLGLSPTIRLYELPYALKRLASVTRLAMTFVKGLGKDRLLRLSSMNRGAILRRVEIDSGNKMTSKEKQLLLELLDNLPAKAGES
jgi:hypothetical protein